MIERWAKISDTQVKLGSTAAGLSVKSTLANPAVSARDGEIVGRERSLLEDALEVAEEARKALAEENANLKNVVLAAANELARATHRGEQDTDDQVRTRHSFFSKLDRKLRPSIHISPWRIYFRSLRPEVRVRT